MTVKEYSHWADEELTTEEVGEALVKTLTSIVESHIGRINTLTRAVSVYDNMSYENLLSAAMLSPAGDWNEGREITFNVLRSIVSTLNSKISKNKILPRIVTTNGKWIKREQSQRLDKYIRGLFYQLKAHDTMEEANLDCLLSGDGFVKVCNDSEKIWLERVMPDEIFVDYLEGVYGKPTSIYQTRIVGIRSILQQYPEHSETLEDLWKYTPEALKITPIIERQKITAKCCVVVEAWTLPCGSLPGKHVITIGNFVVFEEEWDRPYLPFIHLQYSRPQRGYYTRGLYQEIAPIQREITKVAQRISDAQRLLSAPKVFHKKSGVTPQALFTNEVGQLIEVSDMNEFQIWTPPPMSGENFSYLNQLIARAYEISGVSQLSSSSKMPAGIDGASGKALREYNDIETERFALLAQEWERSHKELAEILINEISHNGEFFVKSFDRNSPIEKIGFKDLDIDIDDVVVSLFPVSALPSRPEAKMQSVQELITAGFVDERDAMDLLDIPDLDAYSEVKNSPKGAADKIINAIIDKQVYINPEPMLDLDYIKTQATFYYNMVFKNAEFDDNGNFSDVTNTTLDQLRMLMEDVAVMLSSAQEPAPAPAAPGLPQGLGMGASPEMAATAAASGQALPPGMSGSLPPEAMALLGGMEGV